MQYDEETVEMCSMSLDQIQNTFVVNVCMSVFLSIILNECVQFIVH